MPENIFLSPSLLANPQTFTWVKADIISERTKAIAKERAESEAHFRQSVGGRLKFPQSEYRSNFRPLDTIQPDRSRLILRDSGTPFSGATCSLGMYKSSGMRPYAVLATSVGRSLLS
ncbi:hypothetical protein FOZ63_003311 [Perkinsus olseni]|uniref:Uncharacterized protein n=1 Tax=Perkinsus olseni TaxID=32597 RepID=A0A7J6QPR5_PEROL|nr:hypothetical protein FOZ60_004008 [Perkinsus olseni]KAF4710141.1 hypothetical protein FOZ62_026763 [Perkinsus olseni]KAF4737134.1 hypothetical protein FOZ63_003311 [Perkinsus olseni]